jgi:hypothetical protein
MALPLEPDVAPEDEVLDPFISAPEVRMLAMDVAAQWEEFGALRDALARETEPLRIAFVFETKPFVEGEVVKTHTIAKVTKASPMWAFLGDVDLVVQFRQPFWEHFDDRQRRAVLHHELSHVEFPRGKLALREHDVEDFVGTMRRYGPYLPGRRAFIRAAEIWLEENPEPPSEFDEERSRRRPRPDGRRIRVRRRRGGRSWTPRRRPERHRGHHLRRRTVGHNPWPRATDLASRRATGARRRHR